MQVQSTAQNSLVWRLWHGINYLIGGITFFLGSLVYFKSFETYFNNYDVGAYLFTIGSFTFLLADITEWNHYRKGCLPLDPSAQNCKQLINSAIPGTNFLTSVLGSYLYLMGSIFFIPVTHLLDVGEIIFILGSAVIFSSQLWKLWRTSFSNRQKSIWLNIREDYEGVLVDLFAGLGGLFYFIGTFVFMDSEQLKDEQLYVSAITWFCWGGLSFFASGLFMISRYFVKSQKQKTNQPIAASQMFQQEKIQN